MKVSDFLGRYKPAERTVRVLLDGSLLTELERARQQVAKKVRQEERSHPGLASEVPALEARVAALESEAEEATIAVTLRAMPGAKFDALALAHPPTEAQWDQYREQAKAFPLFAQPPEVDAVGMAPALIALSVVAVDGEPTEWSEHDGAALWETLHDGVRADLLEAAWEVNKQRSGRPFSGTGTDTTPSSGPGSTTQPNGESLSLSSADGS